MSSSKPTVNHKQAEDIFQRAAAIAKDQNNELPSPECDEEIKTIIKGEHKTYRYILVTSLLGKATNSHVNPLALQASAKIDGAYDARSLCHKVVVPLERTLLDRSLGGSNEPYLNKPARFPTISLDNAVRSGKDRQALHALHKILSALKTSEQAFNTLCVALRYTLERISILKSVLPPGTSDKYHLEILDFIQALLSKSIEGQVVAVITGSILSVFFQQFEGFDVEVHPVNQSGSSSRGVSDIDIKYHNKIFAAIEVKDKIFSEQDVDHAAFKARQYELGVISFVMGPNGNPMGSTLTQIARNVSGKGTHVIFIGIEALAETLLSFCPNLSLSEFIDVLHRQATAARVKDEFHLHLGVMIEKVL